MFSVDPEWISLLAFGVIAGGASYVQTMTGFAFGLLVMGAVGLTGVAGIRDAAIAVSVLSLVNTATALWGHRREIDWRAVGLVSGAGAPAVFGGFWLTDHLSDENLDLLRLCLGIVILVSCVFMVIRPEPRPLRSHPGAFAGFGALAGVMGGMFSTSGPPLVYLLYRQPMTIGAVRDTLLTCFAINAVLRLGFVQTGSGFSATAVLLCLAGFPAVFIFTRLARRYPLPWSAMTVRRTAFGLLLLSAAGLAGPVVLTGL